MTSLNGVGKLRLTVEGTSITSCEVLDIYRIAVKWIFVGIIRKASAASLKVTDLFAFTFCKKNPPQKLLSSLVGCLLFVNLHY